MKKSIIFIILLMLISLAAQEARAVDILEIRVKRLYQEAQAAAERGDYDEAVAKYNKAIGYAKDRDIKQFLINARKELQRKRREDWGEAKLVSPEEIAAEPVRETVMGEEAPWEAEEEGVTEEGKEKLQLEEERSALEAERKKLGEEKARLEEEKKQREINREAEIEKERAERAGEEKTRLEEEKERLEAEKKKLEEERANLEAEKRRTEEAEKQARLEGEKAKPEEEKTELKEEETRPILLEEESEEEEGLADLEERKEREAKDRAIYESSSYRHQVKEILASIKNKLKEASVRMEEADLLKRIETKVNKLTELDQKAEAYMSQGQYEKAKAVYEQILSMSKDPDLKEYIKRNK